MDPNESEWIQIESNGPPPPCGDDQRKGKQWKAVVQTKSNGKSNKKAMESSCQNKKQTLIQSDTAETLGL